MELLELDFKNLMNICELNQGDILYFSNRDGFRNSRPENIGFHSQLPDFIVVDDVRLTDNGWQVDVVGFKITTVLSYGVLVLLMNRCILTTFV